MRVEAAAEEAGLQLRLRNVRVFDEVLDIVNFDLVIVLDHFDHTEVSQPVHSGELTCVSCLPGALHTSFADSALPENRLLAVWKATKERHLACNNGAVLVSRWCVRWR